MKRSELEHIIRASGTIAEDTELIIIGSQALLAQFPEAPISLLTSMEADLYPKNRPERSDLVDGCIGEESPFHQSFGYYAHGVSEGTAILPAGWKNRLVPILNENTAGITGWCLDVNDLALSKYVAGRSKDLSFNRELAVLGYLTLVALESRLSDLPITEEQRVLVRYRIRQDFKGR
jgi:hypothetical protein